MLSDACLMWDSGMFKSKLEAQTIHICNIITCLYLSACELAMYSSTAQFFKGVMTCYSSCRYRDTVSYVSSHTFAVTCDTQNALHRRSIILCLCVYYS